MRHRSSVTVLSDPFARSHALVVGIVLAMSLGFEHLGGRHLGGAGGGEPMAVDRLVALEVVLIPLAIAALYMRAQGRCWTEYGLRRPLSGWRTAFVVVAAAACTYALAPRSTSPGALSVGLAAGEELLRRGFLLNETAVLLGGGRGGAAAAVTLLAGLRVLGHLHAGVSDALAAGGVDWALGALYLASGRSLWCVVAARGLAEAAALAPIG